MDPEIEKYVTKQSQLEKHIEELFAEKKILQNRISILNECLSYKKIKQKISELENKKNILKSLENMVYQMKTEIKSLDYLKQLLQTQLVVSSVSTSNDDLNIEKQKCSVNSQLITNSECTIETLDLVSDVGSEGSVMVLSEYDFVSDEEVSENTEKTITNKVMYDEALQMASSIHSLPVESTTTSIETIEPLPNDSEQKDDINCYLQSENEDSIALMNTSIKIKQLLEMYDGKKKDLISCTENAKMKLGNDKEKIESIIHKVCTLSFSDETLGDVEMKPSDNIKHDNVPKLLNDSWVKVDTDELLDISMKSGQLNNIFQTTESQKDNTLSNENLDVQIQMQEDKLCNHQKDSKRNCEFKNLENIVCYDVDNNLKNELCLSNYSRDESLVKSSLLNKKSSCESRDCNEQIVNTKVKNNVENDQLHCHLTELKKFNEVRHFQNISSNNLDHNLKNENHNSVYLTNILKDKTEIDSFLSTVKHESNESKVNTKVENNIMQNDQLCSHSTELKENSKVEHFPNVSSHNLDHNYKNVCLDKVETDSQLLNIKHEQNESKVNTEVKTHVLEDQVGSNLTEFIESSDLKNFESAVCNNADNNLKNKICSSVSLVNNVRNENVIKSSVINTKCTIALRECNKPKENIEIEINNISSDPVQLQCINEFSTLGLNFQLLNGIHQHGFQRLMNLQQKCIPHFINGRDIVLHSYPCAGKSTMCFISVLQRINTCINECQAIILVPTLELALFTQKIIKSLGQFMNVSSCIGGTNVPRKVSPVPHVVISTPQGLCDMINCNSLSKDFIKMLVIDDAEVMIKSTGFFNKMRHILLFLKNDRQLIILSTSKLEEILDHFSDTMQNPEFIILPDEKPSLDDVLQYYVNVPEEWKFDALYELYFILKLRRTIVYCNTWNKSLELAKNLGLKTCTVSAVHSEMDTGQRHLILRQFRADISRVLITTGLLKGEDFSDVIYVINYDFPKCPKSYVRRLIGCLNRQVKVINFITSNDKVSKENIETTFNMKMISVPQDLTNFNCF